MASYLDVVKKLGASHFYPLNEQTHAKDLIGTVHGTNSGAVFTSSGAVFDGRSYVELPDHPDFSAATKGALSVVCSMKVGNWSGRGSTEYIHWLGKGQGDQHEWVFRHYVWPSGTGEAGSRPKRTSFYAFNLAGGLGAGSYFQDDDAAGVERFICGQYDANTIEMWKNGLKRDSDPLSGYNVKLQNGSAPVRVGTRDKGSFLIGSVRRLAFFNRKLTAVELAELFAARTLPDTEPTTSPPTPPTPPTPPKEDYIATNGTLLEKHNLMARALRAKGII